MRHALCEVLFGFPIPALLGASFRGPALSLFLDEEWIIALRTFLRNRFVPQGKCALRVIRTAVKGLAFTGLSLDKRPFTSFFRTFDTGIQ